MDGRGGTGLGGRQQISETSPPTTQPSDSRPETSTLRLNPIDTVSRRAENAATPKRQDAVDPADAGRTALTVRRAGESGEAVLPERCSHDHVQIQTGEGA